MFERPAKLAELLVKARGLAKTPGVYLMKDPQGRVIYVGKALCLPDRVSSYFIPSTDLGPKKQGMLEVVEDFETVPCEDEWEALLAESRLIKDLHPRFNVRLTDDKTYPYLVITTREDFPGVYITREPADERYRGGTIFGPFTSVYALRQSMQLLQRVFRFRTCHLDFHDGDPREDGRAYFRPCLLYAIKQCTGPCGAKISKEQYRADIDRFLRFLGSKRSVMLRELRTEMAEASARQEYEKAAGLRDRIRALEKLGQRGSKRDRWQPETEAPLVPPGRGLAALQKVLALEAPIRCIEAIDIAHLQGGETVGAKVCFVDGRPLRSSYRRYRVKTAENDDFAAVREVVSRRYREAGAGHELYPEVILIDGGLGQLHAAQEAFAGLEVRPPMVLALAKKEELIYAQGYDQPLRLSRHHAGLRLCQAIRDEAHRFAQLYHHILRRKKTVEGDGARRVPKRPSPHPQGDSPTQTAE
jgi:excinuclease ABC subunit C